MKNTIKTEIFEMYIKEHNLSKTKFCKLCKIDVSTFNRILTNQNYRLSALFKIARVINIQVCEMFNK